MASLPPRGPTGRPPRPGGRERMNGAAGFVAAGRNALPHLGFTADLVGQLAVPTFALDAQRRVILWNRACERLTGMPAERVLGTRDHWRAFYDVDRPCLADLLVEGRAADIDAYYPIHHRSADVEYGAHTENWCVMPLRGTRLYLAIDAGPVRDESGRLVAVVETLRDMTLRENAEVRLRAMFDHSPDVAVITERLTGRFLEVNAAFTRVFGHSAIAAMDRVSPVWRARSATLGEFRKQCTFPFKYRLLIPWPTISMSQSTSAPFSSAASPASTAPELK